MTEIHQSTYIEESMKDSYLRYSMSVIISRALPDVRDGLKPVHRRVLYGMHDLGVYPGKAYKKSARIVGDVIGKYHPHGDSAVYETLVRMAQAFSLRYPLVDGQGNFGSVDGDSAAAMRYTEARMARFAEMMLEDLDKDTVPFRPNYDETESEPSVLPSAFPNLLVNGSTGIAVGMATSMAPHNLREIIAGISALIKNPEITDEEILSYVSGPDFPTGGIICGRAGIRSAYLTGRGKVVVRARTITETLSNGRERIIIHEIPYQVNKSNLLEKIAGLVKDKRVEGISDLRDESDRSGMRIVVELKKDAVSEVILNQLFKYTQMQDTFSIYNLALVGKKPQVLTLKQLMKYYLEHRLDVLIRKTEFELRKAEARAHILEGLRIAQSNTDEVIKIIRASKDQSTARKNLEERFALSEKQSEAIVSMRLGQLTELDIDKIENEYQDLQLSISGYKEILGSEERRLNIVNESLEMIAERFGDIRRTSIEEAADDIEIEDLIPDDPMVICLSNTGYIKRMPFDTYRSQGRGGVGVSGANLKQEDFVKSMFVATNRNYLLVLTNLGRAHWMKVYTIPESSRNSRGKAIVNLINLGPDETVQAVLPVADFFCGESIAIATRNGVINKMSLALFSKPRKAGVNAFTLDEGDTLINALKISDESNLLLATRFGQAICFPPDAFRSTGRGARGVRGIRLQSGDEVIGLIDMVEGTKVLTLTENGYGKRTENSEYRVTNRGGKGIRNIRITEKTGNAVSILASREDEDIIVTSKNGIVIRTSVDSISVYSRDSQGVRVIRLRDGDSVMDTTSLKKQSEEVPVELIEGEMIVENPTIIDELPKTSSDTDEVEV
jgi:DNA gyrase subunit A